MPISWQARWIRKRDLAAVGDQQLFDLHACGL